MKCMKAFRRSLIVAVCCALIICMSLPAFAAGNTGDINGIFIGEMTLSSDNFSQVGNHYSASVSGEGFKMYKDGLDCVVNFAGKSLTLRWWYYSGDASEYCFGVGNPYLLDSTLEDNGEDFCFTVISKSKPCTFICNSAFYETYIQSAGVEGLNVSFAVPRTFTENVIDDTGNVFTAAIGMVGTVAATVACNPILYLPIVIGLCGFGVAMFRRLKQ